MLSCVITWDLLLGAQEAHGLWLPHVPVYTQFSILRHKLSAPACSVSFCKPRVAQSFSWDHMAKARHRGSLLLLMPFQFLFLRGPEGGGIRLGGRNLAVGIIISLLNTIHSTFDFFFFFFSCRFHI